PTLLPAAKSLERRPTYFEVKGLDQFAIVGGGVSESLGFPGGRLKNDFLHSSGNTYGGRNSGGSEGFYHPLWTKTAPYPHPLPANTTITRYPFQTEGADGPDDTPPGIAIPVDEASKEPPFAQYLQLTGADLEITIGFGETEIRNLKLKFSDTTVPMPTDEVWNLAGGYVPGTGTLGKPPQEYEWGLNRPEGVKSFAARLHWAQQHNNNPWIYDPDTKRYGDNKIYLGRWKSIFQPGDVVRSLVFAGEGDLRVSALTDDGSVFKAHPKYNDPDWRHAQTLRRADGTSYFAGAGAGRDVQDAEGKWHHLPGTTITTQYGNIVKLPAGSKGYPPAQSADLPENFVGGVVREDEQPGDFDSGIGNLADGPFCGKSDEGNLAWRTWNNNAQKWTYHFPYFTWAYQETYDTFFTPNRQVPSAAVFGSLLAGRYSDWQTLCFSPNPAGDKHPGRVVEPRDHLLLDLWHMPVVEPFAISEPWSTDGKVNLNYPIVPFSHIKRSTGLRAALHSVRVTAFPVGDVNTYKRTPNVNPRRNYRYVVDRDETLKGFDDYFAEYKEEHKAGFFKSASEICERFLYPKGDTHTGVAKWEKDEAGIRTFWSKNTLTGDNVREKPYGDLYPRVTTKSNAYTVHVRAQALRQPVSSESDPTKRAEHYRQWNETSGGIIGEYRGCSTIERYIDPDDRRFNKEHPETLQRGDYIDVDKESLEDAYRFRVALTKRFAP
ncbi:MAG: Verru_Chthon cassette protein A, partial [Verrucomicrobiota bacterium]|nr:Verru_Chthon cassette protein A [Verrucomicrobiota bacterium]